MRAYGYLYFSLSLSLSPPLPSFNTLSPQTERDVSVRQRAIDLLYAMCDHTNAQTIMEELLHYLKKADYYIRETMVYMLNTYIHVHIPYIAGNFGKVFNCAIWQIQ